MPSHFVKNVKYFLVGQLENNIASTLHVHTLSTKFKFLQIISHTE